MWWASPLTSATTATTAVTTAHAPTENNPSQLVTAVEDRFLRQYTADVPHPSQGCSSWCAMEQTEDNAADCRSSTQLAEPRTTWQQPKGRWISPVQQQGGQGQVPSQLVPEGLLEFLLRRSKPLNQITYFSQAGPCS